MEYEDCCVRIPMIAEARSLNLSNSVAIVAYEALRQQDDFAGLTVLIILEVGYVCFKRV